MKVLSRYANDFLSLFYPEVCGSCGQGLVTTEEVICTQCLYELPYTNFHLQADNPLVRQFAGRISIKGAIACFYFHQHSKVQRLVHQLKYHDRPQVGNRLGRLYAAQLTDWVVHQGVDLIIPVPLHPAKERIRGYNQSACFAQGLSEGLKIPVDTRSLKKELSTESQTSKHRFSRFENMQGAFSVCDTARLINRHILLVDDIVTTGATIEGCALELLKVQGLRLSIAAIAFTD